MQEIDQSEMNILIIILFNTLDLQSVPNPNYETTTTEKSQPALLSKNEYSADETTPSKISDGVQLQKEVSKYNYISITELLYEIANNNVHINNCLKLFNVKRMNQIQ